MKQGLIAFLLSISVLASAEPLSLNGLWAMSLGADFSLMKSDDVQALYQGGVSMPETQVFPGIYLSVRKHVSDSFYLGLGLSTLPKAYSVQVSATGETENYDWNAVYPFVLGGWVWYSGSTMYSYVQAEAGYAVLNQASFSRKGVNAVSGAFEGSAFASAIGLGGVWLMIPSVGLNLEGGYRRANLDSVSFSLPPGKISINDSGPYGRLCVSFFWGMKNPWGEGTPVPQAPGPPAE